jgi:hypothetical protein
MSTAERLTIDLLTDSFTRIRELVVDLLDGADDDLLTYRPDAESNTIAWLVWHLTRIQDDHVQDLAGSEQAWTDSGWAGKFGLPFDDFDTGYGHQSGDVAEVRVSARLLDEYHGDVHRHCLEYVDSLTADELTRVVDERWDPPVTASARLVSVLGDCLQHLGQAAYVRGLAVRAGVSP